MRRAAYFLMRADYFGRGIDDGVLRALHGAGFEVDVFSPEGEVPQSEYPDVRRMDVGYHRRGLQHCLARHRRGYDLFLGTADLPMTFAGILAAIARRPSAFVCDEIFLGGYTGLSHSYWLPPTRWAMRNAAFTVIPDRVRIPLQREFARIAGAHEFLEYPCCHAEPWTGIGREEARGRLGIEPDECVVSVTGALRPASGAHWALGLVDRMDTVRLLIQPGIAPDPVLGRMLERLAREGKAIYLPSRVGYEEAMEITAAADVSLILYLSGVPQFQHMGTSSQKLCNSLRLGIPVVALRQPSFSFIEETGCGLLVSGEDELPAAIERIMADRAAYSGSARRAFVEVLRTRERLEALTRRFASLR